MSYEFNNKEFTKDHAEIIKYWRVHKGCTWGRIGELCQQEFNMGDGGQMSGRNLCDEAAKLLGEDPNEEPWN